MLSDILFVILFDLRKDAASATGFQRKNVIWDGGYSWPMLMREDERFTH
jgi:hypothetical protein